MVKLSLPLALEDSRTACQQPYGFIVRPDDGREQPRSELDRRIRSARCAPAGLAVSARASTGSTIRRRASSPDPGPGALLCRPLRPAASGRNLRRHRSGHPALHHALLPHGAISARAGCPTGGVMNPAAHHRDLPHRPAARGVQRRPALPDGLELTALKQAGTATGSSPASRRFTGRLSPRS